MNKSINIRPKWWKEEVIYQIYPRSFNDSNGDGIGDIQGIIEKLDYLEKLGIDILWISPLYKSPNDDNGYDISDYYDIHPEFGTMDDFDQLLEAVHDRGMRLIMDLVVNHTSDEHKWFEESMSSKDNPKRDYYIWKKGKDGGPPNNWISFFGGSAWELDETTGEYYLHLFTKKQPDLNWENPKVRQEIYKLIKFWLDKGIDGFRMDVIPLISKDQTYADTHLGSFNAIIEQVYSNGPRVHEFINEMYETVLRHYDIMTVGEGPGITKEVGINYVGHDRGELNMIFHLDHMYLGSGPGGKFDPVEYGWAEMKQIFMDWDEAMGDSGWLSIFLDNHDFPRLVSRFGNDRDYREESAKMLATLILTLRGTACIYQGSEIGMTNVAFPRIDDYRDVETINFFEEYKQKGISEREFLKLVHDIGRDNVRTPIQWDDTKNGGFSTVAPWIKTNPNFKEINIESALKDQNSIFFYYQKILKYRKDNKTLVYGQFNVVNELDSPIFIYERFDLNMHFYILLNHSDQDQSFDLDISNHSLEISNYDQNGDFILKPWEARIYKR